ncbi:MAG: hypothetical protein VX119_05950 [Bacteroidota bacterium]|nr:hypothetical protein [Bacteroidota bacterium]MEC8757088.1 hypothetical protein [Bacteroidota bacterium]MEC8835062.1 hypothetical protein [Bacteroidota bacterium]
MNLAKAMFRGLWQSNIWIACNALALHVLIAECLGLTLDWSTSFVVFGGTCFVYNALRYRVRNDKDTSAHPMVAWQVRHEGLSQALMLLGLGVAAIGAIRLPISVLLVLFVAFGLVGIYMRFLRVVGWLKTIIVGVVWSIVLMAPFQLAWSLDDVLLSTVMALFIIGLTLPFEIHDQAFDRMAHPSMKTVVHRLGIRNTIWLSIGCFVVVGLLSTYLGMVSGVIIAIVCIGFVVRCHEKTPEFYYYFLLDGMMATWLMIEWALPY